MSSVRIRADFSEENESRSERHHDAGAVARVNTNYSTDPGLATALLSFRNLNVYVVGEVGHPNAKIVRIVHISDTRGAHEVYADHIPRGHILIHSGDFTCSPPSRGWRLPSWCRRLRTNLPGSRRDERSPGGWREQVKELDRFFAQQPHDFKIFVPGCWENWCSRSTGDDPTPEKIQSLLKSAIYLEDAWCQILGLKFYGTSWTAADDLRSVDGAFPRRYWTKLFSSRRTKHSTFPPTSDQASISSRAEKPDGHTTSISPDTSTAPNPSNGFVLPSIHDVSSKWQNIPDDTNVVITHMPAWRQELFVHISQRIRPTLQLCGHDFTGYGVLWKRETLFSNAALQLTSTFPPAGYRKPVNEKRSGTRTTTRATPNTHSVAVDTPATITTPTAQKSNIMDGNQSTSTHLVTPITPITFDPDFCEPPLYQPKPNGRPRPPRWQRRLPRILSRLFYGGGCTANCSLFRRSLRPKPAVLVSETQSSRAAAEHVFSDVGFIYDPDMRAGIGAMAVADSLCGSGSGAGYSGGSTGFTGSTLCSSLCRRTPIVIDVYVVNDDLSTVLPHYSSAERNSPSVE
ncbi:hypothetical protein T265_00516 [Opisthorchis viverrini]|uniref:Calcineurin-like phosphoesterase domain-containing protein n=1 Tax=Opisthorchis viverrini TaxID=6198 RepID=A0A075AJM1_OPIVI|nr:hypothetical protein T265_00516 [Opisthorchis viverrini]KER33624.1 hypothetical protein T265_00516 [Opisthorchis viverrini]